MHAMMSHGRHWGEPYVRSYHGEGTRILMVHMWPMIIGAWFLFMLGMLMGTKKGFLAGKMGGMGHGMGGGMGHGMMGMGMCEGQGKPWMMRKRMMMHHHHHGGSEPCCCAEEGEQRSEPVGTM